MIDSNLTISNETIDEMKISKITLGTAQLGMDYGIANLEGKPKSPNSVLQYAIDNGISTFDTAPLYEEREKILGNFFQNKQYNPTIISKISRIKLTDQTVSLEKIYSKIRKNVMNSLDNLQMDNLSICLLHHPPDMNNFNGLVRKSLVKLKEEGLIDNIGVSIYDPTDAEEFLQYDEFDVIQVPVNIFDRRLITSGILEKLKDAKKIILARSIFLQGLFFLDPFDLPKNLEIAKNPLKELNEFSLENNRTIHEIAFKFVRDLESITSLIIGVDNFEQLEQTLKLVNSEKLPEKIKKNLYNKFNDLPEELINPLMWISSRGISNEKKSV